MKIFIPRERLLSASHDDEGFEVAAGFSVIDSPGRGSQELVCSEDNAEHLAFSWLIQFLRRSKGLSVSQLAEKARVDLAELVSIENDVHFEPRPRTVHQLAAFFSLPERKLLELSNLTNVQSPELREAAVRFAANAKNIEALSKDERQALNEFVKVLGSQ